MTFFKVISARIVAADLAGTITYQQVLRYTFDNIEKAHGEDARTQNWIAALPKEETTVQVLSFNREKALFTEDESEKAATPPGLILAVERNGETAYVPTSMDLTPPRRAAAFKGWLEA